VVSIDTFMNRSTEKADVVLPAAGYAETDGSTTNVEGRVSVLARKVTPPGTARADWMLAAELAYRLGGDLSLDSVAAIWSEIEALAPAHAGITRELLLSPAGADGVLVPLRPDVAKAAEGQPVRITGVEGSTPDGHALAEAAEAGEEPAEDAEPPVEALDAVERAEEAISARPPAMQFSRDVPYTAPAVDSYSLRLIAQRKLYDLGTLVQHAPSIAGLIPGSTLLVHPTDLDRLGVRHGAPVKVTSPRATLTIEAHPSNMIPRGAAVLTVNQPGPDPADLIDATQPVTDIRIETV
jgi:predicted molibdopterin-dependent oxidoreductase YjgC